jgi:hypothetical protein
MRLIIAGSRTITDSRILDEIIEDMEDQYGFREHNVFAVLCGKASGVDTLGEQWAKARHITVEEYPALWHHHGRGAGFIRNVQMAENADALLAISESLLDGKLTKGTQHMVDTARKKGLATYVYVVREGKTRSICDVSDDETPRVI